MGRTQERIEAVIGARDEYSRVLKRFEKDFTAGFEKVARSARTFALVATAAAAGVSAALIAVTKSTASAGDEFQKMSLRTGVSAEALSELKHAAELSGASIEDVETGFRALSKRMLDAQNGLATSQRTFDRLGISITDSNGHLRDIDAVFMDTVTALNNLSSSTERAAFAQELFSRSGTKLLPLILAGREGIEQMRQATRDMGNTFSDVEANQAAAYIDSLGNLEETLKGVKNTIGKEFVPAFTVLMDVTTAKIIEFQKSGDLDIWAARVSKGVITSFAAVAELFTNLPIVWNYALSAFKTFGAGVIAVIQAITIPLQKYYELWASIPRLGNLWQEDAEKLKNLNKGLEDTAVNLLVSADANKDSSIAWAQWQERVTAAIESVKQKAIEAKKALNSLAPGAPTGGEPTGTPPQKSPAPATGKGTDTTSALAEQVAAMEKAKADLQRLEASPPFVEEPENELARLQALQDQKMAMLADHNALVLQAMINSGASIDAVRETFAQQEIDREKRVATFKMQMASQNFGMAANFMQNLTVIAGKEGGAMFELMKGFAIAQAVIDTLSAANKALNAGVPPWNFVAAASVVAAGMARVAQIKATEPGTTAGSTIGPGGTTSPAYTGGSTTAGPPPVPVTQADNRPPINVTVQIHNPLGTEDWDKLAEEEIAPALERALGRNITFTQI